MSRTLRPIVSRTGAGGTQRLTRHSAYENHCSRRRHHRHQHGVAPAGTRSRSHRGRPPARCCARNQFCQCSTDLGELLRALGQALGAYSHAALKDLVSTTGIEYNRLERGIAHFYTDQKSFDAAGHAVELMRKHGVQRRLVSRDELLKIEPAFKAYGDKITGGTYTSTDESGDARVFTQERARRCMARGAQFLYGHDVLRLNKIGNAIDSVAVMPKQTSAGGKKDFILKADAVVVACGSYSAPLLRSVGVDLPIYPGKGYSATFPLLKPEGAPMVSTIDDGKKIAMSRLGNYLRVAGTIELNGWDLTLDSSLARARCHMLSRRIEAILPGVCDTRTPEQGGDPQYWTGLRPATPTNIPFIGQTRVGKLWVNAGHGTLGWTHGAGSGKALAELISGEQPAMNFGFLGHHGSARRASATALAA